MYGLFRWSSAALVLTALVWSSPIQAQDASPKFRANESIELTCRGTDGGSLAESVTSRAFDVNAKIGQAISCNGVLADLLRSGLEVMQVRRLGNTRQYNLEGSAFAVIIGEIDPTDPVAAINCNPSTNLQPWTCKCNTEGHCLYLELFCNHVDGEYYQCDEDESTESDRADRAIGVITAAGKN